MSFMGVSSSVEPDSTTVPAPHPVQHAVATQPDFRVTDGDARAARNALLQMCQVANGC